MQNYSLQKQNLQEAYLHLKYKNESQKELMSSYKRKWYNSHVNFSLFHEKNVSVLMSTHNTIK